MRALVVSLVIAPLLLAQVPRVAVVDFYGVRQVSLDRLRRAVGVREGDRLPASKPDIEDRLERIPGVVLARVEAVCCEGDRAILYVGIEERDAPHFGFHAPPQGDAVLPNDLVETYQGFLGALEQAARVGDTAQNVSQGHELAANLGVLAFQVRFPALAEANLDLLRRVVRQSANPEHRAIAAYLLGYAPVKLLVVGDVQYAMQDSDEGVRANAMRALTAMATLGARDPELGIRVQPTWFIEMLNSVVWSDRYRAAQALVLLTEDRPAAALDQLRERALRALVEMARWKTPEHALPSFLLVGRLAGLPEAEIHGAWTRGERERVIRRATGAK
ncbi:MAG: hypothetical protein ABSD56_12215 [Bryobacteraceae bacterium]